MQRPRTLELFPAGEKPFRGKFKDGNRFLIWYGSAEQNTKAITRTLTDTDSGAVNVLPLNAGAGKGVSYTVDRGMDLRVLLDVCSRDNWSEDVHADLVKDGFAFEGEADKVVLKARYSAVVTSAPTGFGQLAMPLAQPSTLHSFPSDNPPAAADAPATAGVGPPSDPAASLKDSQGVTLLRQPAPLLPVTVPQNKIHGDHHRAVREAFDVVWPRDLKTGCPLRKDDKRLPHWILPMCCVEFNRLVGSTPERPLYFTKTIEYAILNRCRNLSNSLARRPGAKAPPPKPKHIEEQREIAAVWSEGTYGKHFHNKTDPRRSETVKPEGADPEEEEAQQGDGDKAAAASEGADAKKNRRKRARPVS